MLRDYKKKKIIGLTMRVVKAQGYNEYRDAISHDWVVLLEKLGYNFVFIPNVLNDVKGYLKSLDLSGFILTGGDTVNPNIYNKDGLIDDTIFFQRDVTEKEIIQFAIETGKSILGVCRGMQVINYYFGGKLINNIEKQVINSEKHVANYHKVSIIERKYKDLMVTEELEVNSYHNQGIDANTLANSLTPWSVSSDGIIEAVSHKSHPITGIMWHPERECPAKIYDQLLINEIFK